MRAIPLLLALLVVLPNRLAPAAAEGTPSDLMLALDLSVSMQAEDYKAPDGSISRLDVAKRLTREFIAANPGRRIGAVAFAGVPVLLGPPSVDHAALLERVAQLDAGFPRLGSAMGSALVAAARELMEGQERARAIVLVTDGDCHSGFIGPRTAARISAGQGIALAVICLGTEGQAPIPITNAPGRTAMVNFKVDDALAKEVAAAAEGFFAHPATIAATEGASRKLNAFIAGVKPRSATETSKVVRELLAAKAMFEGIDVAALPIELAVADAAPLPPPNVAGPLPLPLAAPSASAAGPAKLLRARIRPETIAVGETATLELECECELDALDVAPPQVKVPGLEISSTSMQQSVTGGGTSTKRTLVLHYDVRGERAGKYTIPALSVPSPGQVLRSEPVGLRVTANAQSKQTKTVVATPVPNVLKAAKATLTLAKTDLVEGEKVHATLELETPEALNAVYTGNAEFMPEGFVFTKLAQAAPGKVTHGTDNYNVVAFSTDLIALRQGGIVIPPVQFPCLVRRAPARQSSLNDFFATFNSGSRETYDTAPVTVIVKPRP